MSSSVMTDLFRFLDASDIHHLSKSPVDSARIHLVMTQKYLIYFFSCQSSTPMSNARLQRS